jgi:hypothetical protein
MAKPPKIGFKEMWRQFTEQDMSPQDFDRAESQRDKARSCLVKKAHPTEALADKALAVANASGTGVYKKYLCRHCRMWHIGHDKPRWERT